MTEPHRCRPAAIAPARRTRAGWNQALLAFGSHLLLDLDESGRFDAGLFASLAPVDQELVRRGGSLRIHASDAHVRAAIAVAGLQRLLPSEGGAPLDLSCTAAFSDDEIHLAVHPGIGLNPRLSTPISHSWIGRIAAKRVLVDLGELSHVNSVLVAWLLQLAQAAKPAELVLINVNRQVTIQFKQLRLNHVLQVQPSQDG